MIADTWSFIRTWGAVVGPGFDIVGAILVFKGVHVTIYRARALERTAPVVLIDDVGSPEIVEKNERFELERAKERLRASRWAAAGLAFLVLGFLCQVLAGWPRS